MNLQRKYFILSFIILLTEGFLLYMFRTPFSDVIRLPRTFDETITESKAFYRSVFLELFSMKSENKNSLSDPIINNNLLETKLIAYGLVNINSIDSSIKIKLKYSSNDNFLHKKLYLNLNNCYLQKEVAYKLVKAQHILKLKYPFYSLLVFDGVRPVSVQKTMWNELQVPNKLKNKYVSDPTIGSLHNFGCAVDVSIVNENDWEMDMGTPYDYFGELGHPIAEQRMVNEGKLSWRQFENRKLLREVMTQAGFMTITTEWWHFNGSSLKTAAEKYKIVE